MTGFTLDGYANLVTAFLERGYAVRGYADADPAERHLILRHDIDMCLDAAVAMAEAEHRLGVRATYFVLLRTEFYNLFSTRGSAALRRVLQLGHGLGLHLDTSLYAHDIETLEAAAKREIAALAAMVPTPVEAISFHRPAKALLGLDRTLAGRPHAYQPRFFSEMGYCSDSRGAWHHDHPLAHPAVQGGRALQLLTHPIWWYGPPALSVQERLDRLAVARLHGFRRTLGENCEPYEATRALSPSLLRSEQ